MPSSRQKYAGKERPDSFSILLLDVNDEFFLLIIEVHALVVELFEGNHWHFFIEGQCLNEVVDGGELFVHNIDIMEGMAWRLSITHYCLAGAK